MTIHRRPWLQPVVGLPLQRFGHRGGSAQHISYYNPSSHYLLLNLEAHALDLCKRRAGGGAAEREHRGQLWMLVEYEAVLGDGECCVGVVVRVQRDLDDRLSDGRR